MKATTLIADRPPSDGRDWDCQCARCGSSCASESCPLCDGDGYHLDDCDDPDCDKPERFDCPDCQGDGQFHECLSSPEHCEANPRAGREETKRGAIEWFTFDEPGARP